MLRFLRHAAKTWVFKALFAVLIVSFAIWGIGDVSIGGAGNRVAQVGDETISVDDYAMALQREMQAVSRRAQRKVTMEEAEAAGIPQNLLARLARDAALNSEADRLGVSADDHALRQAITSSPSFQGPDGSFDKQQYQFVLNQLGFDVDRFESDMRRSLAREAIARGISGGAEAAPGYADAQLAPRLEKRALGILSLPADAAEAPAAPDEAALRAWFDDHADAYVAPERRDVVWLEITPEAMASEVEVPEADLRDAYEAAKDHYDIPERRVVDRLTFADDAAAEAAKTQVETGEKTFADLAAEKNLTLDDVTLGELTRATAPSGIADVAFEGEMGVKGPVQTGLGPALVNVRAILPAKKIPFEEAQAELRTQLAGAHAADLAAERAEHVADLIAGGATLEEIAQETGLPLQHAEGVTREGANLDGAAARPAFLDEVFAAQPGAEPDLIDLSGGAWAAPRVEAVTPSAPLTFEEAHDRVLADWTAAQRLAGVKETAKAAEERLRGGESLDAVAADLGVTPIMTGEITRDATVDGVPAALIGRLFKVEQGGVATADSPDAAAVGVALEVIPADLTAPTYAEIAKRWRDALDASVGRDLYAYYAQALQNRYGATVNEAAMRQVINRLR